MGAPDHGSAVPLARSIDGEGGQGHTRSCVAEHALLASRVLAPLGASGPSYGFGDELRTAVTQRALLLHPV